MPDHKARFEEFRAKLRVNKHRLDDALEEQAEIMGYICEQVEVCASLMHEVKQTLEQERSRLITELKRDTPKITVAEMDAQLAVDPTCVAASDALRARQDDHARWRWLLESWRVRDFAIRGLGDLYEAGYFASDSLQHRATRDRPDAAARAAVREASASPPRRRRIE